MQDRNTIIYLYEPFYTTELCKRVAHFGNHVGWPYKDRFEPPKECTEGSVIINESRVLVLPTVHEEKMLDAITAYAIERFPVVDGYEEEVVSIIQRHQFLWGKQKKPQGDTPATVIRLRP